MSIDKYKEFRTFGRDGAKKRWGGYRSERQSLLIEVSKQVDKKTLNLIQAKFNNDELKRLLKAWKK